MEPSSQALILDAVSIAKLQPWTWPWWRPAPGEAPTFGWLLFIHVTAIVGLILFPLPGWNIVLTAWALFFWGGLGTTVAFHRGLAHKSVKLHPIPRDVLILFTMLNGGGAPISWVANHRLHHAKSDTPEDISSPRVGGFWWSHLRWLWQAGRAPVPIYCKDLDTPTYRKWTALQIPLAAIALTQGAAFALAFDWPLLASLFWIGPIRLVWALHAQCFVNSICHLRPGVPMGEPTARNVPWLGFMHTFQGEQWHENHHHRPGSARLGFTAAQLDVGWYTILLLEKLGLATDVCRPHLRENAEATTDACRTTPL